MKDRVWWLRIESGEWFHGRRWVALAQVGPFVYRRAFWGPEEEVSQRAKAWAATKIRQIRQVELINNSEPPRMDRHTVQQIADDDQDD